jgi:hypothetical protein
MPKKFEPAELIESVAFDKRETVDDGYGNQVSGPFQEQFQTRAKFIRLRVGENVMAGRLQSHSTVLIQVRSNPQTLGIGPNWQMRDLRRGDAYNIREVHQDTSRQLIELLSEAGVATG